MCVTEAPPGTGVGPSDGRHVVFRLNTLHGPRGLLHLLMALPAWPGGAGRPGGRRTARPSARLGGTAPALKAGPARSWTLCHVRPPRPLRLLGSMMVSQPFSPSRLDASGEGRSGCAWLPHGSGLPAPSPPARGLALVFCNSLARLFSPGKCELQLRTGWGKCACVQCGCARAVCVCSACAARVQCVCTARAALYPRGPARRFLPLSAPGFRLRAVQGGPARSSARPVLGAPGAGLATPLAGA